MNMDKSTIISSLIEYINPIQYALSDRRFHAFSLDPICTMFEQILPFQHFPIEYTPNHSCLSILRVEHMLEILSLPLVFPILMTSSVAE
jgi:hypothetical protein